MSTIQGIQGIIIAPIQTEPVTISPEGLAKQKEMLDKLASIVSVTDAESQHLAVAVCRDVNRELKDVEKNRNDVLGPCRTFTTLVNGTAKTYCAPLEKEVDRIGKLVSGFQKQEEARVRREEAERIAEQERLRREAIEAQRLAAEAARQAELARQQAEQARLAKEAEENRLAQLAKEQPAGQPTAPAGPTTNVSAPGAALPTSDAQKPTEASLSPDEAATIALIAKDRAQEALAALQEAEKAPPPAPVRAPGMRVVKVVKYEITDANAVFAKYPAFFELAEKKAVINASIYDGFQCPGMRVWTETQSQSLVRG